MLRRLISVGLRRDIVGGALGHLEDKKAGAPCMNTHLRETLVVLLQKTINLEKQ